MLKQDAGGGEDTGPVCDTENRASLLEGNWQKLARISVPAQHLGSDLLRGGLAHRHGAEGVQLGAILGSGSSNLWARSESPFPLIPGLMLMDPVLG